MIAGLSQSSVQDGIDCDFLRIAHHESNAASRPAADMIWRPIHPAPIPRQEGMQTPRPLCRHPPVRWSGHRCCSITSTNLRGLGPIAG